MALCRACWTGLRPGWTAWRRSRRQRQSPGCDGVPAPMRAPEFWSKAPGLASALLEPFGMAWQAGARLRRAAARPYRPPVPVVCVGNLVAGGSGKTPVVLALAGIAARLRLGVQIVTRGYGGSLAGPVRVDPAAHVADQVGDEARLLAAAAPCWVARDRAAGVRSAADAGADAILLDDGFQNPFVEKHVSLLVLDAEYGFGNGRVVPAGPLREPVQTGLKRADAVVVLGEGSIPEIVVTSRLPIFRARLRPVRLLGAGQRLVAFAGIGRPEKFFASLRAAGAELAEA